MAQRGWSAAAPVFRVVFVAVLAAAAAGLVLFAIYRARSVLLLVLIALFLAVGLDPATRWLQEKGLKRGQAVTVLAIASFGLIFGFLAAVVPALVNQVTEFATNVPEYLERLAARNERIAEFVNSRDIATRLQDATKQAPSNIGSSFGTVLGIAGSVITSIFNVLTVLVLTIYFSLALTRMRHGALRFIPKSKRERVASLADPILEKIGGYIAGNVVVSLIAGVVSFIFMLIAGVPYPLALAVWVAIADLIPLVGATLGAVPAIIVAFFGSVPLGIATLVFFLVYQQLENYVVVPRIMKKSIDLSPAAVLLAALIGGALLGAPGVLMGIPLAAGLKLLSEEIVFPAAEKH